LDKGYYYLIVGSPDDGFTLAEIYADTKRTQYLGQVFELTNGWYVKTGDPSKLKISVFVETVLRHQSYGHTLRQAQT
jgi:hypothetical protein